MHRLLQTTIPLFLLSLTFAGCSKSDDEKYRNVPDGWVEALNGWIHSLDEDGSVRVLIKEPSTYPDSVSFNLWIKQVSCRPSIKEDLPEWLIRDAIENTRRESTYIYQGVKIDSEEKVYIQYNIINQYYRYVYDSSQYGKSYGILPDEYREFFLNKTKEWKCIFILVPHKFE